MTKQPVFCDRLSPCEAIAGWIYLPLHFFVIPILARVYAYFSVNTIDNMTINIVYYGIGVLFLVLFMRNYFRVQFDDLLDNFKRCIKAFAIALVIDYVLSIVVAGGLSFLIPLEENPNELTVGDLANIDRGGMLALAVFIAPFIEETLFRGVVFGRLRRKSRIAAYAASIALFCLYHIWQYLFVDLTMLLYAVQYIPVSLALAYSYESSGSIFVPIALHMFVNSLAFLAI